jgi:hypothetical protein
VGYGLEKYEHDIEEMLKPAKDGGEKLLSEITIRTGLAHDELTRLRGQVEDSYGKTAQLAGEVDKKVSDLSVHYEQVELNKERADSALSQLAQARAELDNFTKQYNDLVAALKANSSVKLEVESVKQTSPEQGLRRRASVYFHYSGLDREHAAQIRQHLNELGWHIPGQQRVSNRVNEIRYIPQDKPVAELLQKEAGSVLLALHLKIDLKLEERRDAKQGLPEIWIYEP